MKPSFSHQSTCPSCGSLHVDLTLLTFYECYLWCSQCGRRWREASALFKEPDDQMHDIDPMSPTVPARLAGTRSSAPGVDQPSERANILPFPGK